MNAGIIIPAAGSGQRFGGQLPKQYQMLGGVPVIVRALRAMRDAFPDAPIVIAVDLRWASQLEQLLAEHNATHAVAVTSGGATRQESVYKALGHSSLAAVELILIHDAVRPFATPVLARRVAETAAGTGAAVPVIPPKDTVKLINSDNRCVESTLPRTRVGLAQTPQAFNRDILIESHQEALRDRFDGTDDASIVEYAGYSVTTIEGEESNIKITTPLDWVLAEHLLNISAQHRQ